MGAFEMIENIKDWEQRQTQTIFSPWFFFFEVLNKIFKSYSGVHKNLASLIKILLVSM